MEQLADDLRRHGLDQPPVALCKPPEAALGARELGHPDRLGAHPERCDGRDDGQRCLPLAKPVGLLGDDPLGTNRFRPAAGQRRLDDRLEVVDVVEETAVDTRERRVDVSGDCQVEQ
jgi:hypothetical protein